LELSLSYNLTCPWHPRANYPIEVMPLPIFASHGAVR